MESKSLNTGPTHGEIKVDKLELILLWKLFEPDPFNSNNQQFQFLKTNSHRFH